MSIYSLTGTFKAIGVIVHYNAREISDVERSARALSQIEGKRLTYRRIGEAAI